MKGEKELSTHNIVLLERPNSLMYKLAACPFAPTSKITSQTQCPSSTPSSDKASRYDEFTHTKVLRYFLRPETPFLTAALGFKSETAIAIIRLVLDHLMTLEQQHPGTDTDFRMKTFVRNHQEIAKLEKSLGLTANPDCLPVEIEPKLKINFNLTHPVQALFASAHLIIEALLLALFPVVISTFKKLDEVSCYKANKIVKTLVTLMETLNSMDSVAFAKIRVHLQGASGGDSTMLRILGALILNDEYRITAYNEQLPDLKLKAFLFENGINLSTFKSDNKDSTALHDYRRLQLQWMELFNTHMHMAVLQIGSAEGTDGGGVGLLRQMASFKKITGWKTGYTAVPTHLKPIDLTLSTDWDGLVDTIRIKVDEFTTNGVKTYDASAIKQNMADYVSVLTDELKKDTEKQNTSEAIAAVINSPHRYPTLYTRLEAYLNLERQLSRVLFWCAARDFVVASPKNPTEREAYDPVLTFFPELHQERGRFVDSVFAEQLKSAVCETNSTRIGCLVGGAGAPMA